MFLQGQLQVVFDALYTVGTIDPVLKMDWQQITQEMSKNPQVLGQVVAKVNSCRGNLQSLIHTLQSMDEKSRQFVALEVAREYSEYQDRQILH